MFAFEEERVSAAVMVSEKKKMFGKDYFFPTCFHLLSQKPYLNQSLTVKNCQDQNVEIDGKTIRAFKM